jgi:hypothetical protein
MKNVVDLKSDLRYPEHVLLVIHQVHLIDDGQPIIKIEGDAECQVQIQYRQVLPVVRYYRPSCLIKSMEDRTYLLMIVIYPSVDSPRGISDFALKSFIPLYFRLEVFLIVGIR